MLRNLLSKNQLVMLQECGALAKQTRLNGNIVIGKDQAGAFNGRCSTAIVGTNITLADQIYLQSSTGRFAIAATLRIDDEIVIVATLHAESGSSAKLDRRTVINKLTKLSTTIRTRKIIIGGDFNSSPPDGSELKEIIKQRNNPDLIWCCTSPMSKTHKSGKILDYFIYTGIKCDRVSRALGRGGSDHYPVGAIF